MGDMRIDFKIADFIIKWLEEYKYQINKLSVNKKLKEWQSLFRNDDKIISRLNDSLQIFHFKDSVLSQLIYNGFEESELLFLRRFLSDSDVFVDIGSNIGLFSLHAAEIVGESGSVYAIEPTQETFSRLVQNVRLNNFEDRITCDNIGLSDENGMLSLNISLNGYDAWNTFATPINDNLHETLDVPVKTLDTYIIERAILRQKISLIKIDVEGWELHVLNGARDLLTDDDAPVLIVEFAESYAFAAGTSCYEVYDKLLEFGYRLYSYDKENNQLILDTKRLHYPYLNLIAAKDINKVVNRIEQHKS